MGWVDRCGNEQTEEHHRTYLDSMAMGGHKVDQHRGAWERMPSKTLLTDESGGGRRPLWQSLNSIGSSFIKLESPSGSPPGSCRSSVNNFDSFSHRRRSSLDGLELQVGAPPLNAGTERRNLRSRSPLAAVRGESERGTPRNFRSLSPLRGARGEGPWSSTDKLRSLSPLRGARMEGVSFRRQLERIGSSFMSRTSAKSAGANSEPCTIEWPADLGQPRCGAVPECRPSAVILPRH